MYVSLKLLLILAVFMIPSAVFGQEPPKVSIGYVKDGLKFSTSDNNFSTVIGLRFQLRFYTPVDDDPLKVGDFDAAGQPSFIIRRARLKMGGNYRSLRYKFEYDLIASRIYDLYFSYENSRYVQVRIGQYKALYNRERVISSARGLLIDRSIVNRPMTIDRQIGATLSGNVGPGGVANFTYYASVHTGTGSMGEINDDDKFMYIGRLQWNFLGEDVDIYDDDSDLANSVRPMGALGFAALANTSSFNRFDSGLGGVLLDGSTTTLPGQYKTAQYLQDFILKYKGISLLQEYHYKKVEDVIEDSFREIRGFVSQAGFFPGYLISGLPKQLQFAARYAWLDDDIATAFDTHREYTAGINWYFNGFNNRLQVDYSYVNLDSETGKIGTSRYRIQWDLTF